MNTWTTRSALLLLSAGSAALLGGCGGGGGNGNTVSPGTTGTTGTTTGTSTGSPSTSQIIGKVTDVAGNGVPGVSITVDTGGQIASTISTGGYRLSNLTAAIHKITASSAVSGVQYTGSTQVATTAGNPNYNVNILLSRADQQATVQGVVRSSNGSPVAGASVYLAIPNAATAGSTGRYSSLVAFTDSTGFYQIMNVPVSLPTGSLLLTASTPTTANQVATLAQTSITPGSVSTQNFTLSASTGTVADTPQITGVNAFTQPTDGLVGSALQAHLSSGSGSVYEGLRRRLSPSYALLANRKQTLSKHLVARATGGSYAVEVDVAFTPPAAADVNLLGYNVYRTTGPIATNPITEANADFYDQLLDPLANYYTDLTAATDVLSTPYAGGTAYNFALSSFSTVASSTASSQESALSTVPYTITPLSLLTLNTPTANQTVTSPVTLSWSPVAGATKYYVYIYSQYPSISTQPINSTQTPLPAGTSTASIMIGGSGQTYYAVVVAAADETESAGATAPVINAAQSYSEIVPFTVQ